jgi:hypothetical integral membrane protein (TIGR02206 family)
LRIELRFIAKRNPRVPASFTLFGALHLTAVTVCALALALFVAWGVKLRDTPREEIFRRRFAIAGLVYWALYNVWWHRNGLDLMDGLPLHICDVSGVIGPLALLTGYRFLRATLYCWTFTLTLQAFIQPALVEGLGSPVFWLFFLAHSIVFACALYDLVVLRFRPDFDDLRRAYAFSLVYLAMVVLANALIGSNYAFIGDPAPPARIPPFIDALGPWPQRAIIVVIMAAASFALLVLPWRLRAKALSRDVQTGSREENASNK